MRSIQSKLARLGQYLLRRTIVTPKSPYDALPPGWPLPTILRVPRSHGATDSELSLGDFNERMDKRLVEPTLSGRWTVEDSRKENLRNFFALAEKDFFRGVTFCEPSPSSEEIRTLQSFGENTTTQGHYVKIHLNGVPCETPCSICVMLGKPKMMKAEYMHHSCTFPAERCRGRGCRWCTMGFEPTLRWVWL